MLALYTKNREKSIQMLWEKILKEPIITVEAYKIVTKEEFKWGSDPRNMTIE